jgi:drug/metabolite transporter (DMT)-like permease
VARPDDPVHVTQAAPGGGSGPVDAGLSTVVPVLFVLLWATGFVAARLAMPQVPPLGFLMLRFAATLVVLAPLILIARAPWPDRRGLAHLAVAGLLIQAGYLAGVWIAVALGMSAGLVALMTLIRRGTATRVASLFYLVPPVTALQAWALFREPFGTLAALGMLLTGIGVALVVGS